MMAMAAFSALALASCTSKASAAVIEPSDGGNYHPTIDPAAFGTVIDNAYYPLKPGSRWVYQGTADGVKTRSEIVVTPEHKKVIGIDTLVVRDTVTALDGGLIEDTFDLFAQDTSGNVWYFGEDVKNYAKGKVTDTKGSWQAGVSGALPGIVMPGTPKVGVALRNEYLKGEAEDLIRIERLGVTAAVLSGSTAETVVTTDWTPLEPKVIEQKVYAKGIGRVSDRKIRGTSGDSTLVSFTPGT
jgi:hypothetical protein